MFKKNGYTVVKNVISKDLANFLNSYFLLKKQLCNFLNERNELSPFDSSYGNFTDKQVPNSYSHYADITFENLLIQLKPLTEKNTGLKLIENYSYARIYIKNNELKRHKDRRSCEISTTLNLGGDDWPIYLDPTGKTNNKGIKINLNPGDMLIYRGCDLEHWREPFTGKICSQVFLHYNDISNKDFIKYDNRPMLGLSTRYKND